MVTLSKVLAISGFALLGLAVASQSQPQTPTVPPGVPTDNWISISDIAGIVVTDLRVDTRARMRNPVAPLRARGVVMARYRGEWIAFENISALPPGVLPLW